jgi:hypothetical protein
MSISSMANLAVNRRTDTAKSDRQVKIRSKDIENGKAPPTEYQGASGAALASISAYIPTEVIGLYISSLGALSASTKSDATAAQGQYTTWLFLIFLTLTPVMVWLIYAGKLVEASKQAPIPFRMWPKWEMVAATVSFFVWGAALPLSPVTFIPQAFAAVLIVVVAGLLGMIASVFQRPLSAS